MRNHHARGIAMIWTVMMMLALFACVAMAVDILYVVLAARQLSAGADAASLGGALYVRRTHDEARDKAMALAAANFTAGDAIALQRNDGNSADGDIVIGRWQRSTDTFTPMSQGEGIPNAVRVVAPRTGSSLGGGIQTLFAATFGIDTLDVRRRATAMVGGDIGGGVIALHPTDACSLTIQGNASLTVTDGAVIVNSSHVTRAACAVGNAGTFDAEELLIVGEPEANFASRTDYDGEIYTGVDPIIDPLLNLPHPNVPTANRGAVPGGGGGTVTLQPGFYTSMDFGPRTYVMQSGLYYVNGPLSIAGNTRLDGTAGVMFFVGPSGSVNMQGIGTGWVRLNPLDPLSYANGPAIPSGLLHSRVVFFQHRSNATTMTFRGNNNWQVSGTIYAPAARLSVGGTPDTFSNGLIANWIEVFGTGGINVPYEDQFERFPPFVFLVE